MLPYASFDSVRQFNENVTHSRLGMGRLIAVHGIRGFTAHGSVHRHQFAYRGFFSILIIGDRLLSVRIMKMASKLSSHILYIFINTHYVIKLNHLHY